MSYLSLMILFPSGTSRVRLLLLLLMLRFLTHIIILILLLAHVALLPVVKKSLMKTRRPKKKSPVTTPSTPTPMRTRIPLMMAPKMMMSRRLYRCFPFPFWHLMTKGE
jgi:hypothetical protein